MRAARPAADKPRNKQPEAAPRAVRVDGLERIFRARRPMAAVLAGEGFESVAVDVDGRFDDSGAESCQCRAVRHGSQTQPDFCSDAERREIPLPSTGRGQGWGDDLGGINEL